MSARPRSLPPKPDPDPFEDPIATATVDVVVERGYEEATVEEIVERAGVTQAEFDARFTGKEDCVLKCYEAFADHFKYTVGSAYNSQAAWPATLRAAAYACGEWMIAHPNLTRFGAIEVLFAKNEMVRVRRDEVARFCAELVAAGNEAADASQVSESADLMVTGSILQLLTHRLEQEEEIDLVAVVPHMMYLAVRPYLGEEAARRELTAPRPELPARS